MNAPDSITCIGCAEATRTATCENAGTGVGQQEGSPPPPLASRRKSAQVSYKNYLLAGGISAAVPCLTLLACLVLHGWFGDQSWIDTPLHSTVETSNGVGVLVLAILLLLMGARHTRDTWGLWTSSGLIGLGILDVAHASIDQGNTSVWLNFLAHLVGSSLLALAWIPDTWVSATTLRRLPLAVASMAVLLSIVSVGMPESLPTVVFNHEYPVPTLVIRFFIGAGYLLWALRSLASNRTGMASGGLLFGLLGLFLASGEFSFPLSATGNAPFWLMHAFRLMATTIALIYVFRTFQQNRVHLQSAAQSLAQRAIEAERMTRDLQRTATELQRSNEELEQFAYVASHDLKEPLRMVASYTKLLAEEYTGRLAQEADLYLHYASEGATRMQTLIDDLLMFSRVGRTAPSLAPVDLHDVIAEAMENLSSALEETHARVEIDPLPTVDGHRTGLVQLLQNLVANGLKFRGPQQPRIRISCRLAPNAWEIIVQDNGIGIDSAYHERVFRIFQRLHSREEYPGNGIGLAVCRKIVERHGGRIWVESQAGEGAAFHFTLPQSHHSPERAQEFLDNGRREDRRDLAGRR